MCVCVCELGLCRYTQQCLVTVSSLGDNGLMIVWREKVTLPSIVNSVYATLIYKHMFYHRY